MSGIEVKNKQASSGVDQTRDDPLRRVFDAYEKKLSHNELAVERGLTGANQAASHYQKTVDESHRIADRALDKWSGIAIVASYRALRGLWTGDIAKSTLVIGAEKGLRAEKEQIERLTAASDTLGRVRKEFDRAKTLLAEGKRDDAEQLLTDLKKESVFAQVSISFHRHASDSADVSKRFDQTSSVLDYARITAETVRDGSATLAAIGAAPLGGGVVVAAGSATLVGTIVHAAGETAHVRHGLRTSEEAVHNVFAKAGESAVVGVTSALGARAALGVGGSVGSRLAKMSAVQVRGAAGGAGSLASTQVQTVSSLAQGQEVTLSDYLTDSGVALTAGFLGGYSGAARQTIDKGMRQALAFSAESMGDLGIGMAGAYTKASLSDRSVTYRDFIGEVHSGAMGTIIGEMSGSKAAEAQKQQIRKSATHDNNLNSELAPTETTPNRDKDIRANDPESRPMRRISAIVADIYSAAARLDLQELDTLLNESQSLSPQASASLLETARHSFTNEIIRRREQVDPKLGLYAPFTEREISQHQELITKLTDSNGTKGLLQDLWLVNLASGNRERAQQLQQAYNFGIAQLDDTRSAAFLEAVRRDAVVAIETGRAISPDAENMKLLNPNGGHRSAELGLYAAYRTGDAGVVHNLLAQSLVKPERAAAIKEIAEKVNAREGSLKLPDAEVMPDEAVLVVHAASARSRTGITTPAQAIVRADFTSALLTEAGWSVRPEQSQPTTFIESLMKAERAHRPLSNESLQHLAPLLGAAPLFNVRAPDLSSDASLQSGGPVGFVSVSQGKDIVANLEASGQTTFVDPTMWSTGRKGYYNHREQRLILQPDSSVGVLAHEAQHAESDLTVARFKNEAVNRRHGPEEETGSDSSVETIAEVHHGKSDPTVNRVKKEEVKKPSDSEEEPRYLDRFGSWSAWSAVDNIVQSLQKLEPAAADARRTLIWLRNPELSALVHYAERRLDRRGVEESVAVDTQIAKLEENGHSWDSPEAVEARKYKFTHQVFSYARVAHEQGIDPKLQSYMIEAMAQSHGKESEIRRLKNNESLIDYSGVRPLTTSEFENIKTTETGKPLYEKYLQAFGSERAAQAIMAFDLALNRLRNDSSPRGQLLFDAVRERRAHAVILQADLAETVPPARALNLTRPVRDEAVRELIEASEGLGALSITASIFSGGGLLGLRLRNQFPGAEVVVPHLEQPMPRRTPEGIRTPTFVRPMSTSASSLVPNAEGQPVSLERLVLPTNGSSSN